MSNKITNPFLKQMISEIANKTNVGRLNISWDVIEEAKKKKKSIKKEAVDKKKPADAAGEEKDDGGLPPLGGQDDAPTNEPKTKEAGQDAGKGEPSDAGAKDAGADPLAGTGGGEDVGGEEDSEAAQADAAEAKAELEKAKAEKDQAEKEIKKHSYIKLGSGAGTQFLLGKILDHAFKTNTIDSLAGEMVQKLKITTPEDINAFSEETASYRVIPGFPELLASMKTMATKQPEETGETSEA
jgi:hypothetical protein